MDQFDNEIILLHTNDIHSHLHNVTKVASLIEKFRMQHNSEKLVIVDVGDFMDRMAFETEGTDGLLHRDLLNTMQYDVITLGNNECLSFSKDQLSAIYNAPTSFQVVCCNMESLEEKELKWLLKSTVIEKNGIKLGFIGATINYTEFYKLLNWNATSPIEAIIKEVERLRQSVDVIVVLSHLGLSTDEQLADACPQIDILIGAHTHHLFNSSIKRGNTLMCAAGMGGSFLGEVHIRLSNCREITSLQGRLHATVQEIPHLSIQKIIDYHRENATLAMDKLVMTLDEDLVTDDFVESDFPNLLSISLKEWCKTSLSIVNSGQLLHSLKKGRVTLHDLHMTCPAPINPCILYIKGKYIKEAFEQSLFDEYRAKKIKGYGFRGKVLGYLAISGFKVYYYYNNKKKCYILNIHINDNLIDDDKIYKVASIDMFTFKQGYLSLSEIEEVQYFVPEYLRHILASSMQQQGLIEASKNRNWINIE